MYHVKLSEEAKIEELQIPADKKESTITKQNFQQKI